MATDSYIKVHERRNGGETRPCRVNTHRMLYYYPRSAGGTILVLNIQNCELAVVEEVEEIDQMVTMAKAEEKKHKEG